MKGDGEASSLFTHLAKSCGITTKSYTAALDRLYLVRTIVAISHFITFSLIESSIIIP
jgi:hypothetical protein